MPAMRGRTLWVLTDYSFDNPASDFDVVGLLIMDPERSGTWRDLRNEVRQRFRIDNRRMSWKDLNHDSRKQNALIPFLTAADHISGLAIALAFHRHPAFNISTDDLGRIQKSFRLSANWKKRNLQHMFRIGYCTALLVAGLSRPGQDIHWVSDQDTAFANEKMESDTVGVFARLLTMFSPHGVGQVRYGTTAHGVELLFQEDLAAVPDLMCGAACEIFTAIKREYGDIPDVYAKFPSLTNRPLEFLKWYTSGSWPLKRYICSFEHRKGRAPSAGVLDPRLLNRSQFHLADS
jgi:hypothetical protein